MASLPGAGCFDDRHAKQMVTIGKGVDQGISFQTKFELYGHIFSTTTRRYLMFSSNI